VIAAPTISATRPTAASGTSTGTMSRAAGRIRPIAASTSRAPTSFTVPGEKSSTQPMVAASFSFGCVSFVRPAAKKATASTPAMIHRTTFIGRSLLGLHPIG
jgi:hypothetical protein